MATIKKISKAKNLSAGPSKKTPVAGPVDPKGKWTGIQKRTLGNMKKGGKIKKAPIGALLPLAAKALPMIGKALGGGAGKGMLGKMGGNMLGGLIGGGNDKEESMKKGGKIKKAQSGTKEAPKADATRVASKGNPDIDKRIGQNRLIDRYKAKSKDFENKANLYGTAAMDRTIGTYGQEGKGYDKVSQQLTKKGADLRDSADVYSKKADSVKKSMSTKYKKGGIVKKKMKSGGKITKAKGGKWIQKAIKKPGALRAQLGAKPGKPIPAGKLAAAAKKPGKIGQRARLAVTLGKMNKKK